MISSKICSLGHLDLRTVDFADHSFIVSYGFDLTRLQASVAALGLLSPPLVRRRPDGAHQIICGYQRLLVVKELGHGETPALMVPEDTPATWCLAAALHDNACGRGFNPMEAALMAEKLLGQFDRETVSHSYLHLLGLPASPAHLDKVLSLLTLEAPWQNLAAAQRLTVAAAARLSLWPTPDRQALLPWFQSLHLSHSRQLELVEFLTTLSRRAGNRPADWLAKPELAGLLPDPALSEGAKITRLWDHLRQWCFPRASHARQQFQHFLQTLGLARDSHIRLTPPPAFEDADFRLEIRFRDGSQLDRRLRQVAALLDQPDFTSLLRL